jgi:hypothetical protein
MVKPGLEMHSVGQLCRRRVQRTMQKLEKLLEQPQYIDSPGEIVPRAGVVLGYTWGVHNSSLRTGRSWEQTFEALRVLNEA